MIEPAPTKRCVAIVQARIKSSRLPGKVLLEVAGKTILRHVLERCAAIDGIDTVCCAIPEGEADDPVADEAARCGAEITRGSETNVLSRYHKAALQCDADVVMRVTSDCPLLDPYLAAKVLRLVTEDGADYACNNLPATWPHGLDCEAFQFAWLQRAANEAQLPSEIEHVTPYLRKHRAVRKAYLDGPGGAMIGHRWTIDTSADLEFMQALFARLPAGPESFDYRVPLAIVEAQPELAEINRGPDRNAGLNKSLALDAQWLAERQK